MGGGLAAPYSCTAFSSASHGGHQRMERLRVELCALSESRSLAAAHLFLAAFALLMLVAHNLCGDVLEPMPFTLSTSLLAVAVMQEEKKAKGKSEAKLTGTNADLRALKVTEANDMLRYAADIALKLPVRGAL